jgi:Fe-S-cluster containining protein
MSDEPVSRGDLERALRFLNNVVTQMRSELLQLGAQVVTLTRKLEERGAVVESEVLAALPDVVDEVRISDELAPPLRVDLADAAGDKHDVESPPIPCAELIPICKARCCSLTFRLSTQDLEEGVVRWDYGRPYWNRRRADGYCVHNQAGGACEVYEHRPRTCRTYDCRDDRRIWKDYENRIPAADSPRAEGLVELAPPRKRAEVAETAHDRYVANEVEDAALRMDRL